MKKVIVILSILGTQYIAAPTIACPMTNATYTYDGNSQVTARFLPLKHKALTNVYFTITSSKGQNLWFTVDWGNGFTKERLVSSKTDPGSENWLPQDPDSNKDRLFNDLDFFAFDKKLNISFGKINAAETAPEYIFIPELAPTLWYLKDKNIFGDQQLKRAMFTLTECKKI